MQRSTQNKNRKCKLKSVAVYKIINILFSEHKMKEDKVQDCKENTGSFKAESVSAESGKEMEIYLVQADSGKHAYQKTCNPKTFSYASPTAVYRVVQRQAFSFLLFHFTCKKHSFYAKILSLQR